MDRREFGKLLAGGGALMLIPPTMRVEEIAITAPEGPQSAEELKAWIDSHAGKVIEFGSGRVSIGDRCLTPSQYRIGVRSPDDDIPEPIAYRACLAKAWEIVKPKLPTEMMLWRVAPVWRTHEDLLTGDHIAWLRFRVSMWEDLDSKFEMHDYIAYVEGGELREWKHSTN